MPDAVTAQEASATGQRTMEHLQESASPARKIREALTGSLLHAQFFGPARREGRQACKP